MRKVSDLSGSCAHMAFAVLNYAHINVFQFFSVFGELWNRHKGEAALVSSGQPRGAPEPVQGAANWGHGDLRCWSLRYVADWRVELGKDLSIYQSLASTRH